MALELMPCSNNLSLKHPAQVIAMTSEAGEQEGIKDLLPTQPFHSQLNDFGVVQAFVKCTMEKRSIRNF